MFAAEQLAVTGEFLGRGDPPYANQFGGEDVIENANDVIVAITKAGKEVSYTLPDYNSLLVTMGADKKQQNLVFRLLDELRKEGKITRKTVPVKPPKTYDAGSNPCANVRRRVFTLV